jgi:acetylornithine/N-succinyldiaminopimelate aminotransferase
MVSDPRAALWPNYNPPHDLIFTHGRGSELFSKEGDAYLDFLSGIAVTSFGHSHPHLIAALNDQAGKVWHVSNLFRIPAAELLAQRLVQHSFADNVFFCKFWSGISRGWFEGNAQLSCS